MLRLGSIDIDESDLELRPALASGAGGQHVNKTQSAIQLRLALNGRTQWPPAILERLLRLAGRQVTSDGMLLIEADESRSQNRNKEAALGRLRELVLKACVEPKKRHATRPTLGSVRRRLEGKRLNAEKKASRRGE